MLHIRIEVMCLTIFAIRHFGFSCRYYYNLYKTHGVYIHDFLYILLIYTYIPKE